jgi:hypothetical protein
MVKRTIYVWNHIILCAQQNKGSNRRSKMHRSQEFTARKDVLHIVISKAGCFVLMHVLLVINMCHFMMMLITGCNVTAVNYMEQSPSKADRSLTRQEIPHILWKLKFHYYVHMSPTLIQMKF